MLDRLLERFERRVRVALLHMHTGDLHQALCEGRHRLDRFFQVLPRALRVSTQESKRAPEIVCLSLAFRERDALCNGFGHERHGVFVIPRCQCFERELERLVALSGFGGERRYRA